MKLTDTAIADLDAIYDYISADSPVAAERFINDIVADLARHAELGLTGVTRDWVRPGLRLTVFGKYCSYFRVTDTELVVVRIIHGARDVDAIVFKD